MSVYVFFILKISTKNKTRKRSVLEEIANMDVNTENMEVSYGGFRVPESPTADKEKTLPTIANMPLTDGSKFDEDGFRVPKSPTVSDQTPLPSFLIMGDEFPLLDPSAACREFELEWNKLVELPY